MKKLLMMLLVVGMLISAGGCVDLYSIGPKYDWKTEWANSPYKKVLDDRENRKLTNRQKYLDNHPEISYGIFQSIQRGWAAIGMTTEQVVAAKGRPNDINRTVGSWGTHEQWVYGGYDIVLKIYTSADYLYFENDILTSYQY